MNKALHTCSKFFTILLLVVTIAGVTCIASGFTPPPNPPAVKAEVVKCYPNPATSFVNFEFQKNIDKTYILQIYSFVGKKMTEVPVTNNKVTITFSNDYNRGLYVFQLRDKTGQTIVTGKFQVVK